MISCRRGDVIFLQLIPSSAGMDDTPLRLDLMGMLLLKEV